VVAVPGACRSIVRHRSSVPLARREHFAKPSRPRRQQTRQCRLLPVFHTRRRTPHSSSTLIGSRPTASPDVITQTSHYDTTRNNCTTDKINNIICALLQLSFHNPAVSHIYKWNMTGSPNRVKCKLLFRKFWILTMPSQYILLLMMLLVNNVHYYTLNHQSMK